MQILEFVCLLLYIYKCHCHIYIYIYMCVTDWYLSYLSGQFGVCGWKNGWIADSQWAETQC